jgi:HEAT repeat protein
MGDPFEPLLQLLQRYRQDVHHLRPPPSKGLEPDEKLPEGLKAFYKRWNGASLFRGVLSIRSVADLAEARADLPEVTLFADGPRPGELWAFAPVGQGFHIGRWTGEQLIPLHEEFLPWLKSQVRFLDENTLEDSQLLVRVEEDPACGLLLFVQGEQLMAEGDGDGAIEKYRKAVEQSPELAWGWQRLGEALLSVDKAEATHALLMALRRTELPLPYPGAPWPERGLLRLLESAFVPGDPSWERELAFFIGERCNDLKEAAGAELMEAAALAWARCRLVVGDRAGARGILAQARDRAAGFSYAPSLSRLQLALVRLDAELGYHDEAEETLRRLKAGAELETLALVSLATAWIAHLRDEPWVEELLAESLPGLVEDEDRCDALLLLGERGDLREEMVKLAWRLGGEWAERAELLRGDKARKSGDKAGAREIYRACAEKTSESGFRARVRLGDLAVEAENIAEAVSWFSSSVAGFLQFQLPLREAWARLRLASLGDLSHIEPALKIFRAANLATGVAAVDTLCGQPGNHLAWHLNLAAEYARQRHDAQRLRPPLTRADADRPERRLMAHRAAIAGCDARIVAVLSEHLRADLSVLLRSDGRIQGPHAMRFIAMADLLAGHGSFDAARELMTLLKEDIPSEAVTRALLGAMARSPNMTLAQALLDAISEKNRPDPAALGRIIEVLGWRREKEATSRLLQLAETGSLPVRKSAITALGRIGDPRAIELLHQLVEIPELAEVVSVALLLLGQWRGVDFHGQSLAAGATQLQRSPGEIVGRFGGPSYLLLLLSVADKEGPAALGALHGLGLLGSVRAVPKLLEITSERDPTRALLAGAALGLITGNHEDPEAPHPGRRWAAWWEANGGRFMEGVRYREGRPMTVRRMLERLGHDDALVRHSSYDELVISVGKRLPFDAEGPWRVQLVHRGGWEKWYAEFGALLPQTGWLFHGRSVG